MKKAIIKITMMLTPLAISPVLQAANLPVDNSRNCSFNFQSVNTDAFLSMMAGCARKDGYLIEYTQGFQHNNSKTCRRVVYRKKPWGIILQEKVNQCDLRFRMSGKVISFY